MNDITYNISYCKKILNQALDILPKQQDLKLFEKTRDVIYVINKYQFVELSHLVKKIIKIPDLRSLAIESLGFWLRIPWFKEQAYKIFIKDRDLEVRYSALFSWVSYYSGTKDPAVLRKLYLILLNDINPIQIRSLALMGILNVSAYKYNNLIMANLMNITSKEIFSYKINWKLITKIMKKHIPENLKIYSIKSNS